MDLNLKTEGCRLSTGWMYPSFFVPIFRYKIRKEKVLFMKKYISVLLIVVMASIGLAVCGSLSSDSSNNKKIKVVTTVFFEYDWGKEIAGNTDSR